jgi:hypothetical protein
MTVNANMVGPALRENIITWQSEANRVIFDHFFGGVFTQRFKEDLTQANRSAIGGIVKGIEKREKKPRVKAIDASTKTASDWIEVKRSLFKLQRVERRIQVRFAHLTTLTRRRCSA